MIRYLTITMAFLAVIAISTPSHSQEVANLLQIVVDDTGALQDRKDPTNRSTAKETLFKFLRHISNTYSRETKVIVISQFGAENIWSGDPREIKRSGRNTELVEFVQSNWGGCSDLLRIISLFDENMFLNKAKSHEIIFFSSMIHTGKPCDSSTVSIEQRLPDKFLSSLSKIVSSNSVELSFYWVYDDSRSSLRSQLVNFIRDNGIKGNIKVEAETRSERF